MIRPPASGANTGATRPGQTSSDVSRIRFEASARDSTSSLPTGTIIAPPAACSTRIPTSSGKLVEAAHPTDASVNTTIATRNVALPPKRAAIQPLSGISTASVTR